MLGVTDYSASKGLYGYHAGYTDLARHQMAAGAVLIVGGWFLYRQKPEPKL
jgi:hypothetical protein